MNGQRRLAILALLVVTEVACGQPGAPPDPLFRFSDGQGPERVVSDPAAIPAGRLPTTVGEVTGVRALDGAHFVAAGGHVFRLLGIDAPRRDAGAPALTSHAVMARDALAAAVVGRRVTVRFDARARDADGFWLCMVDGADGVTLNEDLVSRGLARTAIDAASPRLRESLRRRQREAREARAGVHGDPVIDRGTPPRVHAGFCLGLYAKAPDFDYGPMIREIAATGANIVCLVVPWFMESWNAVRIVPVPARTASMAVLDRTIRQAREAGLAVSLLPIVLLRNPTPEHWRGNIVPTDIDHWFDAYNRFILAFTDIAESTGAALFSIGSEFSSLEKHRLHWENVVDNVRGRFSGEITYSANWDHIDIIEFWDRIDVIGMTGYHSLTEKDDPTVDEITEAWIRVRDRLVAAQERRGKPFVFTEVGYASQNGINKDPWNYFISKTEDLKEQADCYEAFARTWRDAPDLFRGAYFYTWWRNNDADDRIMYTPAGKPALDVIRRYFVELRQR